MMRKQLKLFSLIVALILGLIGILVLINMLYAPTLANFFLQNDKGTLEKRNEFLTRVYTVIPTTKIQNVGGVKVVNLDTYQEEGPYIEIRNCVPFPYIRLTKLGESVTFANSGNQRRTIKIEGKSLFLDPGKRKTETFNVPAVPALYAYTCDNSSQPSGFLYVVK